jgi:membrane protease subunit HflC
MKTTGKIVTSVVIGLAAIIGLRSTFYTVDQTQQAVITQFGKPVKVILNPVNRDEEFIKALKQSYESKGIKVSERVGLHTKIPLIQKVNAYDRRLISWDGYPERITTQDKRFIFVDATSRWYLEDPLKFMQTVRTITETQGRLDDIIDSEVRTNVSLKPLIEVVRSSNRELYISEKELAESGQIEKVNEGRLNLELGISNIVANNARDYGIKAVDIRFKNTIYVDEVKPDVEKKMISERNRIAEKYRSEGEGEAQKIKGKKERELNRINSEAYKEVERIKGAADAEATKIYAQAYNKDPELYQFLKTLDVYKKMGPIELVLGTDNEFFKYLKSYKPK